jgi:hypothetical protein
MAQRVPCARATRGPKRPSLDTRSGELHLNHLLGSVCEQDWKNYGHRNMLSHNNFLQPARHEC